MKTKTPIPTIASQDPVDAAKQAYHDSLAELDNAHKAADKIGSVRPIDKKAFDAAATILRQKASITSNLFDAWHKAIRTRGS